MFTAKRRDALAARCEKASVAAFTGFVAQRADTTNVATADGSNFALQRSLGVTADMLRSRLFLASFALLAGIGLGGYLFSDSRPRSFLALSNCNSCYRPNDLAGLLASAGIQRATAALPFVVKETDRCIAIEHPFPKAKFHFVVFPKKDIKDIADVSVDDQQYILDCLAVIRALVVEKGLRSYRVETNGPGLQDVTYLHLHLVSSDGHAQPRAAVDAPQAARR